MSANLDSALGWLREQGSTLEDDLASLVTINSFTDHRDGSLLVAQRLIDLFNIEGVRVERIASTSSKFGDHLVFSNDAPGQPVALIGHLDTVFPPGQFEGYRRDGALARGPGVLDMKGGLVVVAYALKALAREGLLSSIPVRVIVVADEEVGSPEGKSIIASHAGNARSSLVFEAGRARDAIITQRKGTGGLNVIARGKAAHAGNLHHEGVNAIWALARFVDYAQQLTRYDAGTTVNVGKLVGGQGKNTVPDLAEAQLDIRFTSIESGNLLIDALGEAARRAERDVPGASIEVRGGIARQPLERSAASAALALAYGQCAREEGLGTDEAPLLGGGSDANTTSALGIASIDGLGPRGKGFHTVDEQIEVATLIPKTAALVRFLSTAANASTVAGN
ncbi:MAG: M20/M25/M40 family metallo-hydrolase [Polyangiaceae bacterium]